MNTRSRNGANVTAAQLTQLEAISKNDQGLTDAFVNMMKSKKANPAGPPVYGVTDKTFVHTYVDDDGNN